MKFFKILVLPLAVMAIGTAGVLPQSTLPVQAKAKTTLKSFPKSMRGTWYQETEYHKFHAVRFTAKRFSWQMNTATRLGSSVPIHAHKLPFAGSKTTPHLWIYATKKHGFTKVNYWNTTVTLEPEGYYKVAHRRYHGKKIKYLKNPVSLKDQRDYMAYYPTKKLARYFGKYDHYAH